MGLYSTNGEQAYCDPQRAPPCIETCHTTYTSLRSVRFCTAHPFAQPPKFYALQWAIHSPKNSPTHGSICTPCNMWYCGSTRLGIPNGILIGSAIFVGLTTVTDRQTDRQTYHTTRSVTIGHIYVSSTVMQPNNSRWSK